MPCGRSASRPLRPWTASPSAQLITRRQVAGRFLLWIFLGMLAIAIAGGISFGLAFAGKRGLRREA
jgi:hypothetical protein